jgi:hypothetical protein
MSGSFREGDIAGWGVVRVEGALLCPGGSVGEDIGIEWEIDHGTIGKERG